jgi:hypothetical protein
MWRPRNMIKYWTLVLTLFCFQNYFAQEDGAYYVSRDFSTWSAAAFKFKVTKPWSITISEQFRFKKNSSELDVFFTELETKYSFDNGLAIGGGYRFIGDRTDNKGILDLEQRFQADIFYGFKVNRFDLDVRLRGQRRDDLGEKKADGDYARRALRLKLEAKYNIKKWKLDPEVSFEIFRENGKYVTANFNKFRTTIGTTYDFKKAGEVSLFYRYEKDLNTVYPLNHNIIGFQYKFTYKKYKNEVKK